MYNDVDKGLNNLFSVVRCPVLGPRLYRRLKRTEYSRLLFERCVAELEAGHPSDPLHWAWMFWVAHDQARNGAPTGKCAWSNSIESSQRNRAAVISASLTRLRRLAAAIRRLRNVQIENRSWEKLIKQYDTKDTLFYCDPPYVDETRVSKDVYRHEMSIEDHENLLRTLLGMQGRVVLSGYAHPLYDDMLAGWNRETKVVPGYAGPRIGKKLTKKTEVIWKNYAITQRAAA